jgi:hypothetical protein
MYDGIISLITDETAKAIPALKSREEDEIKKN